MFSTDAPSDRCSYVCFASLPAGEVSELSLYVRDTEPSKSDMFASIPSVESSSAGVLRQKPLSYLQLVATPDWYSQRPHRGCPLATNVENIGHERPGMPSMMIPPRSASSRSGTRSALKTPYTTWVHTPKRYLDRFSRFSTAHARHQHTYIQTSRQTDKSRYNSNNITTPPKILHRTLLLVTFELIC